MKYIVVTASSDGELEQKVAAKLRDGCQLVGGVSVAWVPGAGETWAQAMVLWHQE